DRWTRDGPGADRPRVGDDPAAPGARPAPPLHRSGGPPLRRQPPPGGIVRRALRRQGSVLQGPGHRPGPRRRVDGRGSRLPPRRRPDAPPRRPRGRARGGARDGPHPPYDDPLGRNRRRRGDPRVL
ncbi:MAG: Holo-[acyl-carrier-protein] synthase, partial [uncultured Gemmatimonadetes bacterium]